MLKFKMKKACIAMAALVLLVPQVGVVSAHAEEVPTEAVVDEYSISLYDEESNPSKAYLTAVVEGEATAGGMYFFYTIGVREHIAIVTVRTMEDSDIRITGTAYNSWGDKFSLYNVVDQRIYAEASTRDYTGNQMCVVDYSIRVDGPDGGTNVSKYQEFARMNY